MQSELLIREKFLNLQSVLGEKQKRLWAASEAISIGHGGVSILNRATGLSRQTIQAGINELKRGINPQDAEYMRRKGGGRKTIEEENPHLLRRLQELLEDHTKGDPMQPLFWTDKSTSNLAEELNKEGYVISAPTVARLLHDLSYSLQANSKDLGGKHSGKRNSQFEYIKAQIKLFQEDGQPAISIDAKKKELVGEFKNSGREWRPTKNPIKVNVHDFQGPEGGKKAIPYGIYDLAWNAGWVSVGVDHDTAEFAVESIRKWWVKMGSFTYENAEKLLIIADSGGSNSSRGRLWKAELQKLADETGLEVTVCHLPPGTSKWNKIEHRLFCHITQNWRARPLTSYEVVVNLIAHTTTKTGLKVQSELDKREYPLAKKPSKNEMDAILLRRHQVNEEWNYSISPHRERPTNYECSPDKSRQITNEKYDITQEPLGKFKKSPIISQIF